MDNQQKHKDGFTRELARLALQLDSTTTQILELIRNRLQEDARKQAAK